MGDTKIEWSESVWNCLRGCRRVSSGCDRCYAEGVAHRFSGPGQPYEGLTTSKGRWSGEVRFIPEKLEEPLRWTRPRMIFVNSMSDLFHEDVPDEVLDQIWAVMLLSPRHVFQCLTKRPERMRAYLTAPALYHSILRAADAIRRNRPALDLVGISDPATTPAPWIWLGVSAEDQRTADERIPVLLQTPAAVRWVSYEPALGPVDFRPWLHAGECGLPVVDWIVAGGESGRGARPCDVAWLASAAEQCRAAGTPCFIKQLGARPFNGARPVGAFHSFQTWVDKAAGWIGGWKPRAICVDERDRVMERGADMMMARDEGAFPVRFCGQLKLRHPKGGDPAEWPESLRVREFPEVGP